MFEKIEKLELSQEEVAIIEEALHTQAQILNVEAGAGATSALHRLNSVKRVLSTLDQHKPAQETPKPQSSPRWFGMSRIFG